MLKTRVYQNSLGLIHVSEELAVGLQFQLFVEML